MLTDRVAELTRPMGEEELLHIDYPTPRLNIDTRASIGAAILLALLTLGVFIHLMRDTPAPAESESGPASSQVQAQPPTSSTPASEGSLDIRLVAGNTEPAKPTIVVSINGAVAHPGVVTLPDGARVADALAVAQPLPEADLIHLNQAERLADGVHIIVGVQGGSSQQAGTAVVPPGGVAGGAGGVSAPGAAPSGSTPGGSAPGNAAGAGGAQGAGVNINTADAATLTTLPGVGEKTAAAIIDYRTTHGPFATVEDLAQVKGIGPAKLAALAGRVTV